MFLSSKWTDPISREHKVSAMTHASFIAIACISQAGYPPAL